MRQCRLTSRVYFKMLTVFWLASLLILSPGDWGGFWEGEFDTTSSAVKRAAGQPGGFRALQRHADASPRMETKLQNTGVEQRMHCVSVSTVYGLGWHAVCITPLVRSVPMTQRWKYLLIKTQREIQSALMHGGTETTSGCGES